MAEEGSRGNISAAADARAHHIIETADSMVVDGKLSMVEMTTFLKGSRHEGWLEWLLKDKYHAGGHWDYHEHFRQADEDHNSTLDYDEIVASVQQWLDAGSPGLSAPRKPEPPKRAELTDKERELLAFRVAGAPEVVPPPPPRKKASIYEKPHPHAATAQSSMMRTGFSNSAWDGGEAKGLRSRGRAPLLLSVDDVAYSAAGVKHRHAQSGQPQTMAEWFGVWGRPTTKDFETLSSRSEYHQSAPTKPETPAARW